MDTAIWANQMLVNIAACLFGFIAFFSASCVLLVAGVGMLSDPDGQTDRKATLKGMDLGAELVVAAAAVQSGPKSRSI